MNFEDRESILNAAEGCTYIVNVASPLPAEAVRDPEREIMIPAIEGTRAILEAAEKHGVKKVVLVSAAATVIDLSDYKPLFDENDFAKPADHSNYPYFVSKIRQEKLAWEMHEESKGTYDLV